MPPPSPLKRKMAECEELDALLSMCRDCEDFLQSNQAYLDGSGVEAHDSYVAISELLREGEARRRFLLAKKNPLG